MANEITAIDIPSTEAIAKDFDAAADRLAAALAQLKALLDTNHGCWGDDEFGSNFAKSYLPHAEETLKGGADSVAALSGIADSLRSIIKILRDRDQAGGDSLATVDN
jgi:uncharacterized protein YukE